MSRHSDWLSPLNKLIWIEAFKARKSEVKLRDGRTFVCDYDKQPGFVHVTPKDGSYAPRGTFDLKKTSVEEWIYKNPQSIAGEGTHAVEVIGAIGAPNE